MVRPGLFASGFPAFKPGSLPDVLAVPPEAGNLVLRRAKPPVRQTATESLSIYLAASKTLQGIDSEGTHVQLRNGPNDHQPRSIPNFLRLSEGAAEPKKGGPLAVYSTHVYPNTSIQESKGHSLQIPPSPHNILQESYPPLPPQRDRPFLFLPFKRRILEKPS